MVYYGILGLTILDPMKNIQMIPPSSAGSAGAPGKPPEWLSRFWSFQPDASCRAHWEPIRDDMLGRDSPPQNKVEILRFSWAHFWG